MRSYGTSAAAERWVAAETNFEVVAHGATGLIFVSACKSVMVVIPEKSKNRLMSIMGGCIPLAGRVSRSATLVGEKYFHLYLPKNFQILIEFVK